MHHIYTGGKGDPLCPLGFHPQVRWPTRCKRCFRDYKEHGGRSKDEAPPLRKDDVTMSTPSLSSWSSSSSRGREDPRSPASTDSADASRDTSSTGSSRLGSGRLSSSSWTSTPDLGKADEDSSVTVSVTLPRRRATADLTSSLDAAARSTEFTVRRRTSASDLTKLNDSPPSARSRVTSSIGSSSGKSTGSSTSSSSTSSTSSTSTESKSRPSSTTDSKPPPKTTKVSSGTNTTTLIKPATKKTTTETKKTVGETKTQSKPPGRLKAPVTEQPICSSPEVEFIFKVKSSNKKETSKNVIKQTSSVLIPPHGSSSSSSGTDDSIDDDDDTLSVANTDTTETSTLVDKNDSEMQEQIDSLRTELDTMKTRCERVEREKSDILLRRLASYDTTPTKTAASEVLKLQQKVNDLSTTSEDLKDDNKHLSLRVKELERELDLQKKSDEVTKKADELQAKLTAAETLCEELMDENEDMKKELRDLEEEIEEMQDNFREDQADEYSSLKKELEQTTKNCRILSFKLRKSERKSEQLETEKLDTEKKYKDFAGHKGLDSVDKMNKLEADLKLANEVAARLTKELDETNAKLKAKDDPKKKTSLLGAPGKAGSTEKVSRASLTRSASQEDPQQLLRDLQGSLEREADLREQLRFAEEEAASLRKKAARVEEDNDSLALQLKKMATKAKTGRRPSPTASRHTPEPVVEKDEGISDEEDPAELRLLLELNEQESAVLRRKVEELETDSESNKKRIKELEDKLSVAAKAETKTLTSPSKLLGGLASPLDKQKLKLVEEEVGELRKKLIDKEREIERLETEVQMSQKKGKGILMKSKSLDSPNEQQNLDLKRQLQLVEQEATILRTRIQTLEIDNEKLIAENKKLQIFKVTKKGAISGSEADDKSGGLEGKLAEANKTIKELKEKLDKIEKEATKKSGLTSFGKNTELEKVKKELASKTDELQKLSKEYKGTSETLRKLREEAASAILDFFQSRTPKKPTDMHTKLQMKKMVEDLENEIGDILVAFKKSAAESPKATVDLSMIDEKNSTIKALEQKVAGAESKLRDIENEKAKIEKSVIQEKEGKTKIEKELQEEKNKMKLLISERKKAEDEQKKIESELKQIEKDRETWKKEKKDLQAEVEKLALDKKNSTLAQDEVAVFVKKLENLNKELDKEKENSSSLKQKLESSAKLEQEKTKIQKELTDRNKQITEFDKKLSESEEKNKKAEKNLAVSKSKIVKLEKAMEEQEHLRIERENRWKEVEQDLNGMEVLSSSLKARVAELEADLEKRNETIKIQEEQMRKERQAATDASLKAGSAEKREITSLREELAKRIKQAEEVSEKCERLEKTNKMTEENRRRIECDLTKEKDLYEGKASEMEMDLNAERKKIDRMKISHEKELRNRETELAALKVKIRTLEQSSGSSSKKVTEVRDEYTAKIQKLETELAAEKQEYEDLTVKYELLEEEHVVTKAQLVMEKEHIQSQVLVGKREIDSLELELKTLRETFNSKQDTWIKEKLDIQEKLKEKTERLTRATEGKWEMEKARLVAINEEQTTVVDKLKQQNESILEQMEHMRKENEELRKKLDDFDKVSKIQRQMTADSNQVEQELRDARGRLAVEEKNHKGEMVTLKLRYESRVNLISEELQTSQSQVSRFKRERDTFRHMLEEAQAQMADLKSGHNKDSRMSGSSGDELEDTKTTVATLEQQISCMEDELSEARLECSKFKTELVSEKSAWEVKLSEMQSRVNELEEEKILTSGRTKIPGLRTRMELAWHKEREDQHRLLQETSTLARDLRQTLFEVERERDKERLEAKRRHDQVKKASEEEMEENRKKITELQCDLLELRDAHAKLRTTNEKMRREKERGERENRAQARSNRASGAKTEEDDRRVTALMDNIDALMKVLPNVFAKKSAMLEVPGKKKGTAKSREVSPAAGSEEDSSIQMQVLLQRVNEAVEDVRSRRLDDADERERDRGRRSQSIGMRRAGSTESDVTDTVSSVTKRPPGGASTQRKSSLYRKSLSLSETAGPIAQDQAIWKEEDNEGSMTSLDEHVDNRLKNLGRRETSMDSRLSGGSTHSEMVGGEKKKKKSLFGKLTKKLTKSRSIDDNQDSVEDLASKSMAGSDSDMSAMGDNDTKGSKRDLKDRLSGMFKKGSSSRSNSLERSAAKSEDGGGSKTLPRNSSSILSRSSPARSDSSQVSTLGRPLDKSRNPASAMMKRS